MKPPGGYPAPLHPSSSWNLINDSPKSSLKATKQVNPSNIVSARVHSVNAHTSNGRHQRLPTNVPMPVMASADGFDLDLFLGNSRHESRFPVSNERSTSRRTISPLVQAPVKTNPSTSAVQGSQVGLTSSSTNLKSIDRLQAGKITVRPVLSPISNQSIGPTSPSVTPISPVNAPVKVQRKLEDHLSILRSPTKGVQPEASRQAVLTVPTAEVFKFTITPVVNLKTPPSNRVVRPFPKRNRKPHKAKSPIHTGIPTDESYDWLAAAFEENPSLDNIDNPTSPLDAPSKSTPSATPTTDVLCFESPGNASIEVEKGSPVDGSLSGEQKEVLVRPSPKWMDERLSPAELESWLAYALAAEKIEQEKSVQQPLLIRVNLSLLSPSSFLIIPRSPLLLKILLRRPVLASRQPTRYRSLLLMSLGQPLGGFPRWT